MTSETHSPIDLSGLQDRASQLVEAALRAGATTADAVAASGRSQSVDVRNGGAEEVDSSENDAFTLRAFVGNRVASIAANLAGDPVQLSERAVAMAKVSPENPFAALADADQLAKTVVDLDLNDNTSLNMAQMIEYAVECEAAALGVDGVTKSNGASYSYSQGATVLATSTGFEGSYSASRFSASVSVVAGDGLKMERDYDFDSQHHFADLRSLSEIGERAGKRAVERVSPRQVPSQSTTVIFDPRIAKSLVGHLAAAVSGASIARQTSFLRDDLGQKIFNDGVTILDEPHLMRGLGSRPFDAEGIQPDTLKLVEDGVLQSWLLDNASARELGLTTNGRANRAGSGTSPGTTNLTLMPGQRSPEDMIAALDEGFYVTELIGQGVNLITGDYSRGASGFWIENGQLTFAVSEVTIAANLRDIFLNLEPASDIEKRSSVNTPSLLVEGMTVAGSTE